MVRSILALLVWWALVILAPVASEAAPWNPSLAPVIAGGQLAIPVQMGPGGAINPEKDCQTIRRCQFERGGSYRGCISAYTCRRCDFVPARCTISGRERVCRQLQCTW